MGNINIIMETSSSSLDKKKFIAGDVLFNPREQQVEVVLGIDKSITSRKYSLRLFNYSFDTNKLQYKCGPEEGQLLGNLILLYMSKPINHIDIREVRGNLNVRLGRVNTDIIKRVYAMSKVMDNSLPVIEFDKIDSVKKQDWSHNKHILTYEEQKEGYIGKDGNGYYYLLLAKIDKYYIYRSLTGYISEKSQQAMQNYYINKIQNDFNDFLARQYYIPYNFSITKTRKKLVKAKIKSEFRDESNQYCVIALDRIDRSKLIAYRDVMELMIKKRVEED